jgi:hypothetical protein
MDFFLHDPDKSRLPPEEVRLRKVQVSPQPNGQRVKIYLELTPFTKRPNVSVTITSASGKEVAHTSILETMLPKLEFTMHLRGPNPGNEYIVETSVYYQSLPEPSDIPIDIPLPDPLIVDHNKTVFSLPHLET